MTDYVSYKVHSLEALELEDVQCFLSPYLKDYFWHCQPFHLVQIDKFTLEGKTIFDDAIADEWKIVDLLFKISDKFPVLIQVSDTDGEFLLIEVAEELPNWLDPAVANDRIYIYRNQLHIIPKEVNVPNLKVAFDIISVDTRASKKIQEILYAKMNMHSSLEFHNCQIVAPHSIGHLLYYDPTLISQAVNAFYTRDPLSMKVCQVMDIFKPFPENLVNVTVKMTRMMYAQLDSSRFPVMRPFTMPEKNSESYKAYELGMKIACGFEMLYHNPKWNQGPSSINEYNFKVDSAWISYKKRLDKLGYFRGEIQDSALYQILEMQAKEQYLADKRSDAENSTVKNPVHVIKEILKMPLIPVDKLPCGQSDSDKWLEIDPADTEKQLKEKFSSVNLDDSQLDAEERTELQNMSEWVGGFNEFINVKSGVSGALFPGEKDDDDNIADNCENDLEHDPSKFFEVIMKSFGIQKSDLKEFKEGLHDYESDEEISEGDLEDYASLDDSFYEYMSSMDEELKQTKVGPSLPEGPEPDQIKMDMNLVQNLIESFSAQEGLAGPVSNIILSLNKPLPKKS